MPTPSIEGIHLVRPTEGVHLVKNDGMVAGLEPGCHVYEIRNEQDNLIGVVASEASSRGMWWTAARVSPNRKLHFGQPMVGADSRHRAVAAFMAAVKR